MRLVNSSGQHRLLFLLFTLHLFPVSIEGLEGAMLSEECDKLLTLASTQTYECRKDIKFLLTELSAFKATPRLRFI